MLVQFQNHSRMVAGKEETNLLVKYKLHDVALTADVMLNTAVSGLFSSPVEAIPDRVERVLEGVRAA
jgi:hypothetical protein